MLDYWSRRQRSQRVVNAARLYLYAIITTATILVYASVRIAADYGLLGYTRGLSFPEIVVVALACIPLTGLYLMAFQRTATRMLLLSLGVRQIDSRSERQRRLGDTVDELVNTMGLARVDVFMLPSPAINLLAIRTAEDRNVLLATEGAITRLGQRHLRALVAHGLARMALPEARGWSTLAQVFGVLHQVRLGKRAHGGLPSGAGLIHLRLLGKLVESLGRPLHWMLRPETILMADHQAVLATRDPLGLAEALYLVRHQWRGSTLWAPALGLCTVLGFGKTPSGDAEPYPRSKRRRTHPSTAERIARLSHLTERIVAHRFDERLGEVPEIVEAVSASDAPHYLVWNGGRIQGPYLPDDLEPRHDVHARSILRQLNAEPRTAMATRFRVIERVLARRKQACPRCSVPLIRVDHRRHSLFGCIVCRGGMTTPQELGAIGARTSALLPPSVLHRAQRAIGSDLSRLNSEIWAEEAQVYAEPTCPRCRQRLRLRLLPGDSVVASLSCSSCSILWLDEDEMAYLLPTFAEALAKAEEPEEPDEGDEEASDTQEAKEVPRAPVLGPEAEGFQSLPAFALAYAGFKLPEFFDFEGGMPDLSDPERPGDAATATLQKAPAAAVVKETRKGSAASGAATATPAATSRRPSPVPGRGRDRSSSPSTRAEDLARLRQARERAAAASPPHRPAEPTRERDPERPADAEAPGDSAPRGRPPPGERDTPEAPSGPLPDAGHPRRGRLIRGAMIPADPGEIRRKRLLRQRRDKLRKRPLDEPKPPPED